MTGLTQIQCHTLKDEKGNITDMIKVRFAATGSNSDFYFVTILAVLNVKNDHNFRYVKVVLNQKRC